MRQTFVMNHSRIPHFNAVFTSLVGSQVNFGGRTSTANFRLDKKEVILKLPVEGETVQFPTGQVLFGAIVGDETNIGGNSLLQPGTVIGRRCSIFPKCTLCRYIPHDSKVYPVEPPINVVPKEQGVSN
jgi:NDP-sugar pyrophosphorylase family protein